MTFPIHLCLKVQFGNVTNNCEVQITVPTKNDGATVRPFYSSKDIEQLEKVAVKMQNCQSINPAVIVLSETWRTNKADGMV